MYIKLPPCKCLPPTTSRRCRAETSTRRSCREGSWPCRGSSRRCSVVRSQGRLYGLGIRVGFEILKEWQGVALHGGEVSAGKRLGAEEGFHRIDQRDLIKKG